MNRIYDKSQIQRILNEQKHKILFDQFKVQTFEITANDQHCTFNQHKLGQQPSK